MKYTYQGTGDGRGEGTLVKGKGDSALALENLKFLGNGPGFLFEGIRVVFSKLG